MCASMLRFMFAAQTIANLFASAMIELIYGHLDDRGYLRVGD